LLELWNCANDTQRPRSAGAGRSVDEFAGGVYLDRIVMMTDVGRPRLGGGTIIVEVWNLTRPALSIARLSEADPERYDVDATR